MKFDSLGENGAAAAFIFQWQDNGTKFVQVLPHGSRRASVAIIQEVAVGLELTERQAD